MRLINVSDYSVREFLNVVPGYSILSHTWGEGEVTFQDIQQLDDRTRQKQGFEKIRFACEQSVRDGFEWTWVDTCCIDKTNNAELAEAINSMFRWYHDAARCYVYLSDVSATSRKRKWGEGPDGLSWESDFRASRWFKRGWTLQELLAPASVQFFAQDGAMLGDKISLLQQIHEVTQIAVPALRGDSLAGFGIEERFKWAENRHTTREEDWAYSLLGIFGVFISPIYGEGKAHAVRRLRREIIGALDGESQERPTVPVSLDVDQTRMLLDSLRFDQIDARQMTVKNALAKTCKWLLEMPEYLDWQDPSKLGEHHGFLWIKGKPGTGKSTLMKFTLAHARKKMKDTIIISFFFNARGDSLEKSTTGMYRSILLQLFERLPALQGLFDSLGLVARNGWCPEWSVESLESLFEQVVQSLGGSSVMCFIDALDECDERQIRGMISLFERLGELIASKGIQFRVCFSSRHYPYITIAKGLSLILEGQEGHTQDIANYVSSELKIGHSKLAEQVRIDLQEKAAGVFMWVVLVVGILNEEHDNGRIHSLRQRLRDIPGDLHELFRDILTRDDRNRGDLLICIQWVLFARRPLKPEELYFAILSGVAAEVVSEWDPDQTTTADMSRFILSASKGLAEVTKSKAATVQFIHESVKDFLLKENGLKEIWSEVGSNFEGGSQERLKRCCLIYMNIDVSTSLDITGSLPKASSQAAAELRQSANKKLPFLEYATQNILYHANAAEGSGISQGSFLQSFQLTDWIRLNNLFERHEVRRYTTEASLLYILAESNLAALIRVQPLKESYLDVGGERYGPPIFAALATQSNEAVTALLEVEMGAQPGASVLRAARKQYVGGEGNRIKLSREFSFSRQRSCLSYAAEYGDEIMLALILGSGKFDVDPKEKVGRTPLFWAAENGHEAFARLLLEKGADVDAKDNAGRTPPSWAAEKGHDTIVQLLLEKGTDIDAEDNAGRTPLFWAAENGHEAVLQLLLEKGADVNAKNNAGRTPLSRAAERGHDTTVQLLLEKGADIDARDNDGRTLLSQAAEREQDTIVQLLLEKGADVDAKDSVGRTPLSWAAEKGHDAVVQLLLEKGTDIDSKDNTGRTPLFWTASNGHEAFLRLLLEKGADVDAEDNAGRTPLSRAAEKGHDTIVQLLQEKGAEIDARDDAGRTPLSFAAQHGYVAVTNLLLGNKSLNPDSKDNWLQTPLMWAASNGHGAVVQLLLATENVDCDCKDDSGRTPLSWAAANGHEAVVKLLLGTNKVDPSSQDNNNRTPLSWVATRGKHYGVQGSPITKATKNHALQDYQMQLLLLEQQNKTRLMMARRGEVIGGPLQATTLIEEKYVAIAELLLQNGADIELKDNNGQTPLLHASEDGQVAVVRLLLQKNASIEANDNVSRTPLSRASERGCDAVVQLLLEKGAAIDAKDDEWDRTPLSWAAANGYTDTVELLLAKGAAIEAKDNSGRTPLSWAAANGRTATVKLLLAKGAAIEAKDNSGQTPLSWAAMNRYTAIVWLLQHTP